MAKLALLLFAAGSTHGVADELLRVEHGVITRQAQADNGTAHLYVRNVTDHPVSVSDVLLATDAASPEDQFVDLGKMADGEEAGPPWLWWRSLPNPVPPHGFADVAVKLVRPPTHKITLRFTGPGGLDLRRQMDRINDALNVTFVGFTPSLDVVFVYVENRLDVPVRLRTVLMNGVDLTRSTRFLGEQVAAHSKTVLVVRPDRPFSPGDVVFLKIAGEPSAEGATLVRAFSGFPVTWIDGSLPEGLGTADRNQQLRTGRVSGEGLAGYENIMRCPAHAHGTRRQAAAQFIEMHQALMRAESGIPGLIYVCRWEKETNYFVFAELGDVARVMPFAGSASYVPDPLNHRSQWLTALAVQAAAPRPVHAVVPIRFEDSYEWTRSCTPDEIRALVYLPLSRGAKGLCYGKRLGGLSDEARSELAKVTREVDSIRDYLAFSEPMALARANRPLVEAAALLAGDRALVLLVINHSFGDFDNDHVLRPQAQRDVRAEITLPANLTVSAVIDVEDRRRNVVWRVEGSRLVLETGEVDVVRPYLVVFERRGGSRPAGVTTGVVQP